MRRLNQSFLAMCFCPCFLLAGAANASVVEKAQEWLNKYSDSDDTFSLTLTKNKIKFNPAMIDDPTRRKPDITKAKQNLGWEPKIVLEHGLEITYNHMRNSLLNA